MWASQAGRSAQIAQSRGRKGGWALLAVPGVNQLDVADWCDPSRPMGVQLGVGEHGPGPAGPRAQTQDVFVEDERIVSVFNEEELGLQVASTCCF